MASGCRSACWECVQIEATSLYTTEKRDRSCESMVGNKNPMSSCNSLYATTPISSGQSIQKWPWHTQLCSHINVWDVMVWGGFWHETTHDLGVLHQYSVWQLGDEIGKRLCKFQGAYFLCHLDQGSTDARITSEFRILSTAPWPHGKKQ